MKSKIKRFFLFFIIIVCGFMVPAGLFAQNTTASILQDVFALLAQARYDDAIILFDRIDQAEAGTVQMRLLRASVLSSAGRMNEARAIAEAVSSENPNNTDALYILSTIEAVQGRSREQRALLERIIGIDNQHVDALTDLGRIYLEASQTRNAAQYFDRALAVAPNNLDALLGRARVYRLDRDPNRSEALYNQAVSLYPNQADVYQERARLYRGMGFPVQALADLDKAKSLDPYSYWIAIDRASTLLDMNRKEESFEEFQRAVNIDPDFFLAYAYTAGMKDEFGDYDGAAKDYEALTKLNPEYPYGFEGLAFHKMRTGNWAEARDAFVETYRQLPDEWYYGILAGICWMKAVDQTAPRQYLTTAMNRQNRDSIEYFLYRLFYDLSGRVTAGENDMVLRADRETNQETKARILFYLGYYYDIRGSQTLANRYFQQSRDLNQRNIPEWRLNEWVLEARGLLPY